MAETKLPKLPAGVSEAFLELMENPVSFHPAIARLCGGAQAGLMCSQAIYWSRMKQVQERGGWFYKTAEEWEEETCLSRREQDTAKLVLKKLGFMETKLEKVNGAPTLHFKVKFQRILEVFFQSHGGQMECTDPPNGLHENAKSECTDPPNGLPQTAKTIDCTETPNPVHENAKSYKEQETSAGDFQKTSSRGGEKRPRLSQSERDSWDLRRWREEFDKLQGASLGSGNGSDREWLATAKRAAMLAGVTLQRLHELLKPFYPNDPNINRLIEQNPLFPEEPAARPDEESAEQVQRRMESGKRAGVVFEYVRDYVQARISPHSFDTWIKPLRAVSLDEGVLTLRVPSAEFKQIGEKFGDVLEKAIAGRADDVKFITTETQQRATA